MIWQSLQLIEVARITELLRRRLWRVRVSLEALYDSTQHGCTQAMLGERYDTCRRHRLVDVGVCLSLSLSRWSSPEFASSPDSILQRAHVSLEGHLDLASSFVR